MQSATVTEYCLILPEESTNKVSISKVWASLNFYPYRYGSLLLFLDLRRNFGKVPSCRVASLNSTVILRCKPPIGSPPAKVTWYKIGESSSIFRNKGRRRVRKGQLVIKGGQVGDSGEYRCVAQNIARRREGPVIKLVVGGMLVFKVICWEINLPTCWFP